MRTRVDSELLLTMLQAWPPCARPVACPCSQHRQPPLIRTARRSNRRRWSHPCQRRIGWPLAGCGAAVVAAWAPSGLLAQARSSSPSWQAPGGIVLEQLLLLGGGIGLLLLLNQWISAWANRPGSESLAREARSLKKLRIGYPEGMVFLESLKRQGLLEKRLSSLGISISWTAFPSASTLLSALSEGRIDFCGGGGTASIFSQAAEHLFVRVAREKYPNLQGEALLVPHDSSIQSLRDLKGKRIAFDEGSSAHYVLIRALQTVGLNYKDIEPILLPQEQAFKHFSAGELDAWVVWMPYAPAGPRLNFPGHSIADLYSILGDSAASEVPTLYYALPELVRDYPRVLKAILEEVNEAGVEANRLEFAEALELNRSKDVDAEALETLYQHTLERSILPLDEPTLKSLQKQANVLHDLRLIPDHINVHDGRYSLKTRQNWTY